MACENSYRVSPVCTCKDRRGKNTSTASPSERASFSSWRLFLTFTSSGTAVCFLFLFASRAYVMTQSPKSDRFTRTPELICRSSQCGSSSIPDARR